MTPNNKIFFDLPAAAEIVGLSIRQFRRLMSKDQVPLVKINRSHFITFTELQAWRRKAKR